jgi:hypothetical protein
MKKYINLYLENANIKIPNVNDDKQDHIKLDSLIGFLYFDIEWSSEKESLIKSLAKKIEISKKFYSEYTLDWKKNKNAKIATSLQNSLLALALYISFKKLQESNAPLELLFTRINATLKALEISKEVWSNNESTLYKDVKEDLNSLTTKLPISKDSFLNKVSLSSKSDSPTEVPITILYSEGPIARAYLEIFKSLNLKPKKIIEMVSSVDISSGKPVGKFLPNKLRMIYARYSQESKINFWPRDIKIRNPGLQSLILNELKDKFHISYETLDSTTNKLDITKYSDNVETVFVRNLKDKKLEEKLKSINAGNILYTGGGIVPSSLLSIKNTRFIHIHPGYLPDVRGADCTLWSSMIYNRTAATCFYMAPGIDTGDIILSRWMPKLSFKIDKKYDYMTLYRSVYSYIDPWIRALVLKEFLLSYNFFINKDAIEQKIEDGYTYYFMHEKMKKNALRCFFSN